MRGSSAAVKAAPGAAAAAEPDHHKDVPDSRPYKGVEFFRAQDRHLFFGRDSECAELEAIISAAPLSLLHAASGSGKTSLLNAAIIPRLEERGRVVVPARPFDNPRTELIEEMLARVMPPPALEAAAIRRTVDTLKRYKVQTTKIDLHGVRRILADKVPARSPDYVTVRGPLSAVADARHGGRVREVTPIFVRFLTGDGPPILLARQIGALARLADLDVREMLGVDARRDADLMEALAVTRLPALEAFFRHPRVQREHKELLTTLDRRSEPLARFFDRLCALWGDLFDDFAMVLVLDQFEELFTRFGTAVEASQPGLSARMRRNYFDELGELVPRSHARRRPPLQIVISMRDDYIARIDELEAQTGAIPRAARYHLQLLSRERCRQAIVAPAQQFGIVYEEPALNRLVEELAKGADQVEPSHLQIVCERVYEEVLASRPAGKSELTVTRDHIETLKGVKRILEEYFNRFLDACVAEKESQEEAKLDRYEMLDLLERLMTTGGKRNIVDRDQLEREPFRRPDVRHELIEKMQGARIIRAEHRLKGAFVEITHEFLLKSVSDALAASQPATQHLRALKRALEKLKDIEQKGFRTQRAEKLDEREYDALWWYRTRLYIEPPEPMSGADRQKRELAALAKPWLAEFLLRIAAAMGKPPEHVRYWASRLPGPAFHGGPIFAFARLRQSSQADGQVDHWELSELIRSAPPEPLTEGDIRTLVESAISNADLETTADVAHWIAKHAHAAH